MVTLASFADALGAVAPAVSTRKIADMYTHYGSTGTHLYGWNGVFGVSYQYELPFVGGLDREVCDVVKRLRGEEIDLTVEGDAVKYKCGRNRGHYLLLPNDSMYFKDDGPALPTVDQEFTGEFEVTLDPSVLNALRYVARASSADKSQDGYGVSLCISKLGVVLYSTTGISLTRIIVPAEVFVDGEVMEDPDDLDDADELDVLFAPEMIVALMESIDAVDTEGNVTMYLTPEGPLPKDDNKQQQPINVVVTYGPAVFFSKAKRAPVASIERYELALHHQLGETHLGDLISMPVALPGNIERASWSAREVEDHVCRVAVKDNMIRLFGKKRTNSQDDTRQHVWGEASFTEDHPDVVVYADMATMALQCAAMERILIKEKSIKFCNDDGSHFFIVGCHTKAHYEG